MTSNTIVDYLFAVLSAIVFGNSTPAENTCLVRY